MSFAIIPTCLLESGPVVTRKFGNSPFHTDGDTLGLAFTPDGNLWSIEEAGVLRCWSLGLRRQLAWFPLEEKATLWCFSPDGRFIAAASEDLSVWETATGEVQAAWDHPASSWVTALTFRRQDRVLAAGDDDGSVHLWDWTHQEELLRIPAHQRPISALAFSADGATLATAAEDKLIHLWDVASGRQKGTLRGHTDRIPALAWHPDGRRLVSAGWDTTARIWDTATLEPMVLLNSHAMQVHTLALSPDGTRLACADSAHAIHIWDFDRHFVLQTLRHETGEVRCLAFNPAGQCLAYGGTERIIHLWSGRNTVDGERGADPQMSRSCLAVTGAGRRLASLGPGTALRVFDLDTGETALELDQPEPLRAFAASPDDRCFAGSVARAEENKPSDEPPRAKLGLWNASTGKLQTWLEGQAGPVTALAFSPDSETLASAGCQSCDVWLWNVATGKPKLLIQEALEGCSVDALTFQPQGSLLAIGGIDYLATGGSDGRISLRDVETGREVHAFPIGVTALAFSPDGRYLAAATLGCDIHLLDVATGRQVNQLTGHLEPINALAFSPDSRFLASGADDRTLRLWNVSGGVPAGAVELDTQIKALAFSADGTSLFTGNGNTSCYQIALERLRAEQA